MRPEWTKNIKGKVDGTIFDGEEWLKKFFDCPTVEDAVAFFNNRFEGRWKMSPLGVRIDEIEPSDWTERFAMVRLFDSARISIKLRLPLEVQCRTVRYCDSDETPDEWVDFRVNLQSTGTFVVQAAFCDTNRRDSDNDEVVYRTYDKYGNPLSDWAIRSKH